MAVVQKAISANAVKNGSAVVLTGGMTKSDASTKVYLVNDPGPPVIADRSLTQIENKLTTRHDDPTYYTA